MSRPPPDPIYILRGLGASVTALEFLRISGEQQKLVSGDNAGLVNIWNLSRKRIQTTLNGHSNKSILNVHHLTDKQILSQGRDGYVQIWDLQDAKNEIVGTFEVSDLGFCKCEVLNGKSPNKVIAVSSREQSQIDLIDLKNKQVFKKLKPESKKSFGMCMCLRKVVMQNSVEVLLAGYESGDVILWDMKTSKALHELRVHKEPVMCIDVDSILQRGVSGSAENTLAVFKVTPQGTLTVEKTVEIKNPGISVVKIRGDGKIVATGGWDNKLRIFSWKTLKPLAVLNYHTQSVDALAFSGCSDQILAAGSKDGRISLWSFYKDS